MKIVQRGVMGWMTVDIEEKTPRIRRVTWLGSEGRREVRKLADDVKAAGWIYQEYGLGASLVPEASLVLLPLLPLPPHFQSRYLRLDPPYAILAIELEAVELQQSQRSETRRHDLTNRG